MLPTEQITEMSRLVRRAIEKGMTNAFDNGMLDALAINTEAVVSAAETLAALMQITQGVGVMMAGGPSAIEPGELPHTRNLLFALLSSAVMARGEEVAVCCEEMMVVVNRHFPAGPKGH